MIVIGKKANFNIVLVSKIYKIVYFKNSGFIES